MACSHSLSSLPQCVASPIPGGLSPRIAPNQTQLHRRLELLRARRAHLSSSIIDQRSSWSAPMQANSSSSYQAMHCQRQYDDSKHLLAVWKVVTFDMRWGVDNVGSASASSNNHHTSHMVARDAQPPPVPVGHVVTLQSTLSELTDIVQFSTSAALFAADHPPRVSTPRSFSHLSAVADLANVDSATRATSTASQRLTTDIVACSLSSQR